VKDFTLIMADDSPFPDGATRFRASFPL